MIMPFKNILLITSLTTLSFCDSNSEYTDKIQAKLHKRSKPIILSELANNTSKMGVNFNLIKLNG